MTKSYHCPFCGIQSNDTRDDTLDVLRLTPTLDQLSNSNSPPSRDAESLAKDQLAYVQDKIKTLDEAIEKLQKARSSLEQAGAHLTRIMSPIRRAPPEILSEIFLIYAEGWWERLSERQLRRALPEDGYMGWDNFDDVDNWDGKGERPGDQDRADLVLQPSNVLSQVCHSWRTTAHACSSLWSDISIHPVHTHPAARELLRKQLRLSGNRPLRIHTSYQFSYDNGLMPLLQDVVPTSYRWTSINTVIDSVNHPIFPRPNISSPFPLLVSLSLILKRTATQGVNFVYKLTATDVPLLREVSLSWPGDTNVQFDLPWAQLRKFRFWGRDGDDAITIISQLQDVEELDLLGITDWGYLLEMAPDELLHLPSLRCLRLSNVGCQNFYGPGKILPQLRAPALQTLYWTAMRQDDLMELCNMCTSQSLGTQGQSDLRNIHLYNPNRDVFEQPGFPGGLSWADLLDATGLRLESLKIEYPTSSGVDISSALYLLASRVSGGELPNFHSCMLQGVHVNSRDLFDLIECIESHHCDIRVRNCTFDTREEFEDAYRMRLQEFSPESVRDGAYFELDVEAPNRKRLIYTSELGIRLTESCRCRLGGSSLRQDNRSSVLGVF